MLFQNKMIQKQINGKEQVINFKDVNKRIGHIMSTISAPMRHPTQSATDWRTMATTMNLFPRLHMFEVYSTQNANNDAKKTVNNLFSNE